MSADSQLVLKIDRNVLPYGLLLSSSKLIEQNQIKLEYHARNELFENQTLKSTSEFEIAKYFALKSLLPQESCYEAKILLVQVYALINRVLCNKISDEDFFKLIEDNKILQTKPSANCFAVCKLFEFILSHFAKQYDSHAAASKFVSQIKSSEEFKLITNALSSLNSARETREKVKDDAKFFDLVGGVKGQVVVRFPPEAGGYLHIGHAKAALLNNYYKEIYDGKLILRFDDTNPDKEKVKFEQVILEDFKLLGIKYDQLSKTSDHFEVILQKCTQLIKQGDAYPDMSTEEQLKEDRDNKKPSKYREMYTVDEALAIWQKMINGAAETLNVCIRAKIDYSHLNGSMRDPVIYRGKQSPHPHTGTKYKVYPTYVFACPIVDSIENVTHALRTTEYHDKDEVNYWFLSKLGLRVPQIQDYGRLSLQNTVLSKRKLVWFVEEGIVDGWDDPRMPTLRGMMRRGLTKEGLKRFIEAQGPSKNTTMMSDSKLWAFNRTYLEPEVERIMGVDPKQVYSAQIQNIGAQENLKILKNPLKESQGFKDVAIGSKMLIEVDDVAKIKVNEKINLINWMNFKVVGICEDSKSLTLQPLPDDREFRNIPKYNYVNSDKNATLKIRSYDYLITKPILNKDEDFKSFINKNSIFESEMLGELNAHTLKKSEIIQIYRKGLFIVDKPYNPEFSSNPIELIKIPDGKM